MTKPIVRTTFGALSLSLSLIGHTLINAADSHGGCIQQPGDAQDGQPLVACQIGDDTMPITPGKKTHPIESAKESTVLVLVCDSEGLECCLMEIATTSPSQVTPPLP